MNKVVMRGVLQAGVRATAAFGALVVQYYLARILGAEGYGKYAYILSWMALLLLVGKFGVDTTSTRHVAVYREEKRFSELTALFIVGVGSVILVSTILSALLHVFTPVLVSYFHTLDPALVSLVVFVFPLYALSYAILGYMRGISRVLEGDAIDSIVRPAVTLILVFGAQALHRTLDGELILATLAVSSVLVIGMCLAYILKDVKFQAPHVSYWEVTQWLRMSVTIMLIAIPSYVFTQLATTMVGVYRDATEVGGFAMANNLIRLIMFVALIVSAQTQPLMAVAYAKKEGVKLKRLYKNSLFLSLASGVAALLVLMLAGRVILKDINPAYQSAYWTLIALACAQLLNIYVLISSTLLTMTGNHTAVLKAQTIGASVCVAANLVFIPRLGAIGAALSLGVGLGVSAAVSFWLLRATRIFSLKQVIEV